MDDRGCCYVVWKLDRDTYCSGMCDQRGIVLADTRGDHSTVWPSTTKLAVFCFYKNHKEKTSTAVSYYVHVHSNSGTRIYVDRCRKFN